MIIETRRVGVIRAHFGTFRPDEVIALAEEAKKVNALVMYREGDCGDELYFEKELPA